MSTKGDLHLANVDGQRTGFNTAIKESRDKIKDIKKSHYEATELKFRGTLKKKNERIAILERNLNTLKTDYWFMINLIERYGSDKDQTLSDVLIRLKFREPLFNILKK